jgi:hypothetical protein
MKTNRDTNPKKQTWKRPEIKKLSSTNTLNQTGMGSDFETMGSSGDIVPPSQT